MVKHLTARFAWHDSGWNGKICRYPEANIYCTDNFSLLSARIQRRKDIQKEKELASQSVKESLKKDNYLPPCYWCINASGGEKCVAKDIHPFSDANERYRREIQPATFEVDNSKIFSWCFKIGYSDNKEIEGNYRPEIELKRIRDKYLSECASGKSVVFYYCNYGNPITSDERKYLLVGASLVKDAKSLEDYDINQELLNEERKRAGMQNYSRPMWQFELSTYSDSTIILPYNQYLDLADAQADNNEIWERIKEVAIKISDPSLIPNFKQVSMHLSHDKAIFLLYELKKSIRKMGEHGIVTKDNLDKLEMRTDKLLAICWKERGTYPGFKNAAFNILREELFEEKDIDILIDDLINNIEKNGGITSFLESEKQDFVEKASSLIKNAINCLNREKEKLRFLSRFDFSIPVFHSISSDLMAKRGWSDIKNNPYLIYEELAPDYQDGWNIDKNNYGIGLYNIDIALIPDPHFNENIVDLPPTELRYRSLIIDILKKVAKDDGRTYLDRGTIVDKMKDYPLYYRTEMYVDESKLDDFEKEEHFREVLFIQNGRYQLKSLRAIEMNIEDSLNKMIKKNSAGISEEDAEKIAFAEAKELLKKKKITDHLQCENFAKQMKKLYRNSTREGLFVISGKAGTGKTEALAKLALGFSNKGKSVRIFAPTGKASLVISKRIRDLGQNTRYTCTVSTIDRFLYTPLSGASFQDRYEVKRDLARLRECLEAILDNSEWWRFAEYKEMVKNYRWTPSVLIIDEASMVDEIKLALLLSSINLDSVEHLIFVGDKNQLPPIGIGKPFADLVSHLEDKDKQDNIIFLRTNLRFGAETKINELAEVFESDDEPIPHLIEAITTTQDPTLEFRFFKDEHQLKRNLREILRKSCGDEKENSIFKMFDRIFNNTDNKLDLEKIQILSPRRVGRMGSQSVNAMIAGNTWSFKTGTKIINEENRYAYDEVDKTKQLVLANGSIGYIKESGFHFDDINEFFAYCRNYLKRRIDVNDTLSKIKSELYPYSDSERSIDMAYSITVHKAQGSGFDEVILILPEKNFFVSRELMYTALTRARNKLYVLVHENFKDTIGLFFADIHRNSVLEFRPTLLFGHAWTRKVFPLQKRNGETIQLKSKIERMIAKALDDLAIHFEYETEEFYEQFRIRPDFKLFLDGETYYLEHLGYPEDFTYRKKSAYVFNCFKKMRLEHKLITTAEKNDETNIDEAIKKIIVDIKNKQLKRASLPFSLHHYEI